MAFRLQLAALVCVAGCAHRASVTDRSPSPTPPSTVATRADTAQLHVPSSVETLWVFEVRAASLAAERQVGTFGRRQFIALFADMRRQACERDVLLVVVARDAGGMAISDDVTFGGRLTRARFLHNGTRWEGVEIPC
jgi:hypothetical protein